MQLRPYQEQAIQATLDWFAAGKEKPCVVLPTGTGKSRVQAELIRRILEDTPYVRILALSTPKNLLTRITKKP